MNPYEIHALGLQQLQSEVGQSIAGKRGGFVKFANQEFAAIVSPFQVQQRFDSSTAGMRQSLSGDVILQKTDIPDGIRFEAGQSMAVTAPGSVERACQIIYVEDKFTFWQITVDDTNAGA